MSNEKRPGLFFGWMIGTMSLSAVFSSAIVWGSSRLSGLLGGPDPLARAKIMAGQGDYSAILIVAALLFCFSFLTMAFTFYRGGKMDGDDG